MPNFDIDIQELPDDLLKWRPILEEVITICNRDFVVNPTDETTAHFDVTQGKVALAFPKTTTGSAVSPVSFQLADGSSGSSRNLNIYGGTLLDNNSGILFTPTGLTLGQYTALPVSSGDTVVYLIITYTEIIGGGVTSVTIDSDSTLPVSESGVYYLPLGNFTTGATNITVLTSPIGNQVFMSGRMWYTSPYTYYAISGGSA